MTTTWEQLPKNGTDNETIEGAISRLITAHNNDAIAHTAAGQSIDEHRKNDIIDHPAGSILGDKYTNREFTFSPTFESLDNYIKSSAGVLISIGGFNLQTGATANTERFLAAGGQYSGATYSDKKDSTFQFAFKHSGGSSWRAYGVAGSAGILEVAGGIGFKFVNGAVYAVQIVADINGDTQEEAQLIAGVSSEQGHLYRVQQSVAENKIRYYIDATLVHEKTITEGFDTSLRHFEFSIKNLNNFNVNGIFSSVYVSSEAV